MPNPKTNTAAVRPDGPARADGPVRPNGATRPDGAIRRGGVMRGQPDSVQPDPRVAPPIPKAQTMTLPTSFAMPGRPSEETIGQQMHRMRIEGSTGLPDAANASGCAAIYITDADAAPGSDRTVQ